MSGEFIAQGQKVIMLAMKWYDALQEAGNPEVIAELKQEAAELKTHAVKMFHYGKEVVETATVMGEEAAEHVTAIVMIALKALQTVKDGTRSIVKPIQECTSVADVAGNVAAEFAVK